MASPKDVLTKSYLEEHYVRLGKSMSVIAREAGVKSCNSVLRYIRIFNLYRPPIRNSEAVLSKDYLEEYYVRRKYSVNTIAAQIGLKGKIAVTRALKRHGIPMREKGYRTPAVANEWAARRKGCGEICGRYWRTVEANARHRELAWDITIEFAWSLFLSQDRKCALSGQPLVFHPPGEKPTKTTASLDRIDSSQGYIRSNVQWVHKRVQRMKSNIPEHEFVLYCHLIATNAKNPKATTGK